MSTSGSIAKRLLGRRWPILVALIAVIPAMFLLPTTADAAGGHHLFKENLGGVAQPTFVKPFSLAVDQSVSPSPTAGDVLVLDAGANEVQSLKVFATSGQFRLTYGGLTTTATASGDLVSGSKFVKNITGITGTLTRSEVITGTGIQANTTVAKIISPTEIELSLAATATSNGVVVTAEGLAFNITAANLKLALEDLTSFNLGITTSSGPGNATGSTPYTINFTTRDAQQLITSNGTVPLAGGSPASEAVVTTTTPGANSGIKRFKPDGTPDNFSALGTNVIDGQRGPGGKPRAECETAPEPASCDETPFNGMVFPAAGFQEVQIAVDNSGTVTNGNIYVTQVSRKLIYVFGSTGKYLGQLTAAGVTAFGEICGVAAAPNGNLFIGQFNPRLIRKFVALGNPPVNADWTGDITVPASPGSPCNVGVNAAGSVFAAKTATNPVVKFDGLGAVQYSFGSGRAVSVDPGNDHPFVFGANAVATEFDTTSATSAVEVATLTAASTIQGLAANGTTHNVYIARLGSTNVEVFGPTVFPPVVTTFAASDVKPTKATLNGAVNSQGDAITECKFEYGTTIAYGSSKPCEGTIPTDTSEHPVTAALTGLTPNGTTYHYRIVAKNGAGTTTTADRTFVTASTVITEAATGVTDTTATLNGTVLPEGAPFTECKFEYGTTTAYGSTKACTPPAGSIEGDFQSHAVSAALTGLAKSTTYHFRLVAANAGGPIQGQDLSFTTVGSPLIREELPVLVDKTTATLQAKINPNGFGTSYHFEWGETTAYGNSTPADFEPFIGSGTSDVIVQAKLTGLKEATGYHFRIVATNSSGTTTGSDHGFETLNQCGLTQARCFELVSPADKGPVGEAGQFVALAAQLQFQAAPDGEQVEYGMAYGLPDSTNGGELVYRGDRKAGGWQSVESSPGLTGQEGPLSEANVTNTIVWLSKKLDCGFVVSTLPLTDDPQAQTAFDTGGVNLYRRNADDSYTLVSDLVPTNTAVAGTTEPITLYRMVGAAENCTRAVFRSPYKFAGVGYSGGSSTAGGLYEWANGVLSDAGEISTPSGPQSAATVNTPASEFAFPHPWNEVSEDGLRAFFTAPSKAVGPEEGKTAVFLRKGGLTAINVSQSQTPTTNNGASNYQMASKDGSRVFFTARYGLAANGSSTGASACAPETGIGCDLYGYDVGTGTLVDISVDSNPADTAGAGIFQVLNASADGSSVYFTARGQLVPGRGQTYAQNSAGSGAYNLYLARIIGTTVTTKYVTTVSKADASEGDDLRSTSAVTPDGEYLLFQVAANVAGYQSGGAKEAYLYSAETETTVCISCRPDGNPSIGTSNTKPLSDSSGNAASKMHPRFFLSNDGSRAVFTMPDNLALGAVAGEDNLYEWHDGQVSLLTVGVPGVQSIYRLSFLGMSTDGSSIFFRTRRSLVPQDFDQRQDVYVARVGGGFAPPPTPPPPCDPLAESGCQGSPAPGGGSVTAPGSASFSGSGNQANSGGKKKAKKHKKKHKGKGKSHKRDANTNKRSAK